MTHTGIALETLTVLLAQEAPQPSTKTLLEYIRDGGPVGLILIGLSVTAVTLAIIHLVQVRLSRLAPPGIVDQLTRLLQHGDVQGAIAYCKHPDNDTFLTRVFGAALARCARSPFGFLEIRSALEESGQKEVDRLTRVTDAIGLIAALGPMLGLLGTVFGMIGAFGSISALEGAARSRELAGFMSLALVNTAEGLAVAIPCTALFAIFRRRIDRWTGEVGEITETLASYLEHRQGAEKPTARPATYRPPAVARAVPGTPAVGVAPEPIRGAPAP